jgi:hypothetical protein
MNLKSIQAPCHLTPPSFKAVLFWPLPGQDCHLKWWLSKLLADDLDIFYQYVEMGNDERTDM